MKKIITAVSMAAILAGFSVSSLFAQEYSKVTGGGTFLDTGTDGISGSFEFLSFTVQVNTGKKGDKQSPQAVIQVDGKPIQDYWGGPLVLKGDFADTKSFGDLFEPNDPKPPQAFLFVVDHPNPTIGEVNVWIFTHDNDTRADSLFSEYPDWFGIWIEPSDGNGWPDGAGMGDDDLFISMGVVLEGNVMDHRK